MSGCNFYRTGARSSGKEVLYMGEEFIVDMGDARGMCFWAVHRVCLRHRAGKSAHIATCTYFPR